MYFYFFCISHLRRQSETRGEDLELYKDMRLR